MKKHRVRLITLPKKSTLENYEKNLEDAISKHAEDGYEVYSVIENLGMIAQESESRIYYTLFMKETDKQEKEMKKITVELHHNEDTETTHMTTSAEAYINNIEKMEELCEQTRSLIPCGFKVSDIRIDYKSSGHVLRLELTRK